MNEDCEEKVFCSLPVIPLTMGVALVAAVISELY